MSPFLWDNEDDELHTTLQGKPMPVSEDLHTAAIAAFRDLAGNLAPLCVTASTGYLRAGSSDAFQEVSEDCIRFHVWFSRISDAFQGVSGHVIRFQRALVGFTGSQMCVKMDCYSLVSLP